MLNNTFSRQSAMPLPIAADQHIDADLDVALSTPSTLVVNASLELDSADAGQLDLALVIPRSRCRGERPLLAALVDAAQAAVARATRGGTRYRPRRVVTRVGGEPRLIAQFEAA